MHSRHRDGRISSTHPVGIRVGQAQASRPRKRQDPVSSANLRSHHGHGLATQSILDFCLEGESFKAAQNLLGEHHGSTHHRQRQDYTVVWEFLERDEWNWAGIGQGEFRHDLEHVGVTTASSTEDSAPPNQRIDVLDPDLPLRRGANRGHAARLASDDLCSRTNIAVCLCSQHNGSMTALKQVLNAPELNGVLRAAARSASCTFRVRSGPVILKMEDYSL